MKAAVWTKYGPPGVIQLKEIAKPVPKDNEILVKIKAASLSKADCEMRDLDFAPYIKFPMRLIAGWKKPKRIKVLGQELSGVIEEVGKLVNGFKVGDEVLASTGIQHGAHAEYICLSIKDEDSLIAKKPQQISFKEAAAIATSGIEAYCFLKRAELQKNQKVMIVGAGGSFGTLAVQFAKLSGAVVTAVDSGPKLQLLKQLGADTVIDYTQTDYTELDTKYDVVFDIVCIEKFSDIKNILSKNGTYLAGNPRLNHFIQSSKKRKNDKIFVAPHSGKHTVQDLEHIRNLIGQQLIQVVVDKVFKLEEIIEAYYYAESGSKLGNIIIDCMDA